jgi:hypothetical protein
MHWGGSPLLEMVEKIEAMRRATKTLLEEQGPSMQLDDLLKFGAEE